MGHGPRLSEVFVRVGVPTHTFVEPTEYRRLVEGLRTPGLGIVIEGPSGIGKTTATTKALHEARNGHDVIWLSARKPADRSIIVDLPHAQPEGIVVIDDFHVLAVNIQTQLADYLKSLADDASLFRKLVLVGINKTGQSLVRIAPDVAARIETIRFETEPIDQVLELIDRGCEALQITLSTREEIARESNGSFYLAQMLCFETCLAAGIAAREETPKTIDGSFETIRTHVMNRLKDRFGAAAIRFASGTKLRQDGRAPYLQCLRWLAESADWSIDLQREIVRRPEYRNSVEQIVDRGYLANLIENHEELQQVLHFSQANAILSAEDPQFIFYIRNLAWNTFAKEVGFTKTYFDSKYDIALSFAGPDRDIAEALFAILHEEELSVFYDKNEQHRIAGEDVEEYLQPIYESEAEFVVVVIGPEYSKRVWTRFESDHFKERFGDGVVIPVWVAPATPSMFDSTQKVGRYHLTRGPELRAGIEKIADDLLRKLRERRS